MKISGTIIVQAPRGQVYQALRDARLFASCVEGVHDLAETGPDAYSAMFETKVAYMKFAFKVTVQVVRADEPREIEARIEGAPVGIVGRLTAASVTRLTEAAGATRIDYDVETALTGKLGSLPAGASRQGEGDGTTICRAPCRGFRRTGDQSIIPKSGCRFSEKIMPRTMAS